MSGMQLRLQRELFTPNNEQILSMVHCLRVANSDKDKNKPNKDIFLCIVNETDRFSLHGQQNINIVEAKGNTDKRGDLPKRKRSWTLHELKSIDAKHSEESGLFPGEFDLCFSGKTYSYKAVNYEEKKRFLTALIGISDRGQMSGARKISLSNLPPDLVLEDPSKSKVANKSATEAETNKDSWPMMGKDEADEAYRAISDRESSDLLTLMKNCDHAITNADLFVEDLSRQLNILDGDNIYSIMASEESINHLMKLLESAIKNAESCESRLNQYDDLMEHIRDSMEKMDAGGGNFETVNTNNKRLYTTLEGLVSHLDLTYSQIQVLTEPDFSHPQRLKDAVKAARALERALDLSVIDERLLKLAAVQDQIKLLEKKRDKFSKSITRYLNNLFIHVGNDTDNLAEMSGPSASQLKLTKRRHIHRELSKYSELVHWLKSMDHYSFSNLQSIYRTSVCKLYEKDLRLFFEAARYRVSGNKLPAVTGSVSGSSADLAGSKKGASRFGGTGGLLGNDNDSLGSEWSLSERERFDDVMETILIELESVCQDEQQFSIRFFKMDQIMTNKENTQDAKKAKAAMEEARSMMAESFPTLDNELLLFISAYEKADSFFTLHALVRLSKHVLSAQDTGSFLAITLGLVLVKIKRNFDRFMEAQKRSIEEARAPRRTKCGILPFVSNFEKFTDTTETIFKSSERRSDLEKWYTSLVMEMVTSINRISREHTKTPAEVIKMENFHHLHSLLAQMKIQLLEVAKKDVKQRYNDALKSYVTQYFGRPLEKLNVFFDGIQQLVAAGVKESEISYQLAYSKQELRKVIGHYPGREVRKGLDNLYKKVERHLCEEENLIQVVWRAMQEEFIQQYKCIEDLIQRCYPGAQIALDFTINDVLDYFSDIARSH